MSWRSDLNKMQRATYKAQRLERDVYVATGTDGPQRLAKRLIRRRATRAGFQLLRGIFR